MMDVTTAPLEGVLVLRPRVFRDERGLFIESYNADAFAKATGVRTAFVQDNESRSRLHVLRGLHLQSEPHAQAKLVRVSAGAVLDVCVDVRPASPTFGRHFSLRLDDREKVMMYIPEGFAHGFVALEEGTVFNYKCSAYYRPEAERTILWNDPHLAIDWGVDAPLVSDRDRAGLSFQAYAQT